MLRIGVSGMRYVYRFVYRLYACLEKHEQFQRLVKTFKGKVVPRERLELSRREGTRT